MKQKLSINFVIIDDDASVDLNVSKPEWYKNINPFKGGQYNTKEIKLDGDVPKDNSIEYLTDLEQRIMKSIDRMIDRDRKKLKGKG